MFEFRPGSICCLECQDVHHPVPPCPCSALLDPAWSDSAIPVRIHEILSIDIPRPPLRNLTGVDSQVFHCPGRSQLYAGFNQCLQVAHATQSL